MTLTEFIEKWGRTLLETPLTTAPHLDHPELAEIRHAVLDEVRAKSYRAGAKKVFPYDLVRVSLRGLEESRASLFGSSFFRQFLERELQATLQAEGTRFPPTLRIELTAATGLPKPGEEWLMVATGTQESATTAFRPRLLVIHGETTPAQLVIAKPRIAIGREVDVYRNGGLHRRNDLAFVADTEVNASVSREHAHIEYDRTTGECRLFNDRWFERGADCGLRIVRNGVSTEVHRDSRGARLEPGDEIHLGRAVLLFETAASFTGGLA